VENNHASLVRSLNRWDLTALVVNGIIGSGIFGLPAIMIALVGAASPFAYMVGAAGTAVIVACFAEVSTLFAEAGGPYLYARKAFGPFIGLEIGWITWLGKITGAAANANIFALYLGGVWEPARTQIGRFLLITALIATLAAANYRGVRRGALMSNLFALFKLVPLGLFVLVGLFFLHPENFRSIASAKPGGWLQAILLLVFAYGGFENAVLPAGEALRPKRDSPFSLIVGFGVVTLLYVLIQVVVVGTLPPGTQTKWPLATAAQRFLGPAGAWLLSAAALVSVCGWFSGSLLSVPRLTFAMGERGDFPEFFAAVHPRFRTPYVSIVLFAGLSWAMAIAGTFRWNAALSAVARLLIMGTTCTALVVFRRRADTSTEGFRLRGGSLLGVVGTTLCAVLLLQMNQVQIAVLVVTTGLAVLTWAWTRRRPRESV